MSGITVALLAAILVALIVLVALQVYRLRHPASTFEAELARAVRSSIAELNAATKQHVQVAAVVALLEEHDARPDLFDRLAEYADEVVAAALLYRVNSLAGALKKVQDRLSSTYGDFARNSSLYSDAVTDQEMVEAQLRNRLELARDAAQHFGVTLPPS